MYKKYSDSKLSPSEYWDKYAKNYKNAMSNDYHKERSQMIEQLCSNISKKNSEKILDFGCGGGEFLEQFSKENMNVFGIDISEKMIKLAKQNFKLKNLKGEFNVGGLEYLSKIKSNSFDVIIATNVLAYLHEGEDIEFYNEAKRILKRKGLMIVTHSNELFDLFTLNSFTINFFKTYLLNDEIEVENLISNPNKPNKTNNFKVRANPLRFPQILKEIGLLEIDQKFCHYHSIPPLLEKNTVFEPKPVYDEKDLWKLMFKCSIYGSCSIKI